MDEYGEYEEYEDEEPAPRKRSDLILPLTGGTLITAEVLSAMIHGGPLGIGAGLLASGFVYLKGQELLDVVQGIIPLPEAREKIHLPKNTQSRSLKDRLLGNYPEETKSEADEDDEPAPGASALPRRSPRFAKMQHLIQPGQDILGFDGKHFISAESLKHAVNIAIIGVPGAGKTVGLTFHVAQAVLRNAIVRGWDLHGDVAADLGEYFNIMEDVDDIVDDCTWLQKERDRRLALRKQAKSGDRKALRQWQQTRELFYIVDELNALMLRLKQRKADREMIADTLLSLIAEGRKFKMRVIIAGQTMPAALFGENGSSARDIINTKYAFQSRNAQAQYFGIEQQAIDQLLPLISGKDSAGYAILDGGGLLHAILVSIPYTTVDDIRALLAAREEDEDEEDGNEEMPGNHGGNARKQHPETVDRQLGNRGNISVLIQKPISRPVEEDVGIGNAEMEMTEPPQGLTWDILIQIEQAFQAGWKAGDVAALVKLEGRKYGKFKEACDYLGIDPKAKAQ